MGLDDPTKKMSKSENSRIHAIHLLDSPDDIRSSVMKATTDSMREIRFDESRPGIYNLLVLYELFSNVQRDEIEARFEGKGYADLKKELAEIIVEGLRPLRSRYIDLTNDPNYIDAVLSDGAEAVRPLAEKVLTKVKTLMGLG
jgi:tryptophanyl-tRNA synthetase